MDGNPAAGIQGSIVPAASIEFDQREVLEVITRANVRNYFDFDRIPCGVPSNADLQQLRKAIEGFITHWEYIIDYEVTFTVHGPGARFTDLNAAFAYLGRYRITPTGHVILQLAGAAPGAASANQYIYTTQIEVAHPNNDRISIFGAPMLAPVSRDDSGYAWNGASNAERAADTVTNLSVLRTRFATELRFLSPCVMAMRIGGISLMHLDGILFTSDGNPTTQGVNFNCIGYMNLLPRTLAGDTGWAYDGLAAVNFKGIYSAGFSWEVGAGLWVGGEGGILAGDQNTNTPWIAIGNTYGIAVRNGGFVTSHGNAICLSNDQDGIFLWPRSGTQWDGGVFCNANQYHGITCYLCSTGFIGSPLVGGNWTAASHAYKNGGNGLNMEETNVSLNCDFGAGVNVNIGGSIYAGNNSAVQLWGNSANYAATCSPAFNTIGNNNSMIASGF